MTRMTDQPSRRPRRPKSDLRDLAQRYTRLAVETLAEVARTSDKEAARVAAANALLERGWGRSAPTTAAAAPVRIEVITGIDRPLPAVAVSGAEVDETADEDADPAASGGVDDDASNSC